jgi:hypothetical protein
VSYNLTFSPAVTMASPPPDAPATAPAGAPAPQGLDATPTDFELLGIRLRTPAGCLTRSEGTGKSATWIVTERQESPRYILRLSKLFATAPSSPAAQIDEYVKSVSERPSPNAVFAVRSRREFELGGRPAGLLYTSLREGTGEDEVNAVQGYFILQLSPTEFVVVSSLLAESDFAATVPLLEQCFRTIEVPDPAETERARVERMQRGIHLLSGLDDEALRRALDPVAAKGGTPPPRWYRLTRLDPDGTVQESGYMTVVAVDAAQGAANPDRTEDDWDPKERERGLLVRIQMRTLLDPTGKAVNDTDARYWVRWDRQREFWTVRTTARSGRNTRTSSQLGMREAPTSGLPRPTLEVTDVSQTQAAVAPRRWTLPPEGYLSQAEAMVLPRLLPRTDASAAYGFYWFDGRSGRIAQRADVAGPRSGGATVTSRRSLEAPATLDDVDPRGVLLRRVADDGTSAQATSGEELLALWKRKGLPVE